jgi:hypothetical protein
LTTNELDELGASTAKTGPMIDVLLRAALAGDADVIVVPGDRADSPADGVGALLRYTA